MHIVGLLLPALCVSAVVAQEVHFSPEERLDALDASLIAGATRSIDLAPYSLTDSIVVDSLLSADKRGVRIKRSGAFMHLKAYAIDGELVRTGSANFSSSGEREQDNDLVVIRDAKAAAQFEAHFQRMWNAARPMIEFEPAIKALEPK